MAYNYTIVTTYKNYERVANAIQWLHANLCFKKDFDYSDLTWTSDFFDTSNHTLTIRFLPLYIWLNNENDVIALRLATGL